MSDSTSGPADDEYKASKTLLDRVPLDQFSWPEEVTAPAAAGTASARAADESSAAAPAAAAPADIAASWSHMEKQLPADLMKRLRATAWVCTTAEDKMSVDKIQSLISKTLDQAEALQTQVLTEHWWVILQAPFARFAIIMPFLLAVPLALFGGVCAAAMFHRQTCILLSSYDASYAELLVLQCGLQFRRKPLGDINSMVTAPYWLWLGSNAQGDLPRTTGSNQQQSQQITAAMHLKGHGQHYTGSHTSLCIATTKKALYDRSL